MKKKKIPNWKEIIKKMDEGKLCTNDQHYKWLYGCWKAYNNLNNDIDNRELWWQNITKKFQDNLEREYKLYNND
jgi:hypothetical protein